MGGSVPREGLYYQIMCYKTPDQEEVPSHAALLCSHGVLTAINKAATKTWVKGTHALWMTSMPDWEGVGGGSRPPRAVLHPWLPPAGCNKASLSPAHGISFPEAASFREQPNPLSPSMQQSSCCQRPLFLPAAHCEPSVCTYCLAASRRRQPQVHPFIPVQGCQGKSALVPQQV